MFHFERVSWQLVFLMLGIGGVDAKGEIRSFNRLGVGPAVVGSSSGGSRGGESGGGGFCYGRWGGGG